MERHEAAMELLRRLAADFGVRDARKLHQLARREFPGNVDLTFDRARAALQQDVVRQVLAPKPRSLGKSAAEGPSDRLQADLIDFSQYTLSKNKYGLVITDVFTREAACTAQQECGCRGHSSPRNHSRACAKRRELRGHHRRGARISDP